MADLQQLDDWLLDWQNARARGEQASAESLAAAEPELIPELRRRIQAFEQMERFLDLDAPADQFRTTSAEPVRPVPELALDIPGYEVVEELGRGGMGIVYRAVQKSTRREVALKVLLQGRHASPRQRLRFEREIDLAAALRHPNIVKIFDSGVTPDGLSYFAMELVPGRSLTDYAAQTPPREELLQLFQKICGAVNYAHQRGIMHRDLKPSNIRVDDEGNPHILDFGLAKLATPGDETGLTATGEFVGTIAYASPEQVSGAVDQVDLRTDVYALGVILYELLTGTLPIPPGPLAAMLQAILEGEPTSPGLLLRKRPGADSVDEDLDAIVLKALARGKQDRYQTAGEFANDLESYQNGGPIQAKPPGLAALLWAWFRQNVRTTIRIVGIGVVCGSLSAVFAGLPRMLPFLRASFAAQARIAGAEPMSAAVPAWLMQLLTMLAILPFAGMGLMLTMFVRPRNRWDDALAGLAAGLVAGLTAFAVCGGWGSVVALTVLPVEADLHALSQTDDERLLVAHPELASLPAAERRGVLRDQIIGAMVVGIPLGIWLGLALTVSSFAAFGVLGSVLAGILVRREGSWNAALVPYLESTILATGTVLALYVQVFFLPRSALRHWLALGVFASLACLAPVGVVRQWHSTCRAAIYVAGFMILVRLVRPGTPWQIDATVLGLAALAPMVTARVARTRT